MGIFSFIKDAGAKVFGIGKSTAEENVERAASLKKVVTDLGFDVKNFAIEVDDETAKLSGEVAAQATREKIVLVVGNTVGISSVEDNMTVEEKAPMAQFHTVERGDTLGKIAKTYYGNAMKYPVIFEANKPMLKHPDKIYPGQVLRIPALDS